MPTPNGYIRVGQSEIVPGRPFTNPARSAEDVAILRQMADRLRRLLSRPDRLPDRPPPLILHLQEADRRCHRVVISNFQALLAGGELTVVGFFGQKRPEADRSLLDAIDGELIDEFPQHPEVLSYSSRELANGNWGNLVLLSHPEGVVHWGTNAKHTYAACELAPKYYESVRLHNAVLAGGLMSGGDLILLRTKYYDFRGEEIWRAIREAQSP